MPSMIQMRWDKPGDKVEDVADAVGKELRADLNAASGYDDLAVYVNYAHGDETPEQIYGARKLQRLSQLKAKYDPRNTFRFGNALPRSYP